MEVTLYAQPYDITASGFYFETPEQYEKRAAKARNDFGQPVEEFEIQFIDGDEIDCALSQAWEINQADFPAFLEAAEDWDDETKRCFIIAVGECGYDAADVADDPESVEIDLYYVDDLKELAEQFIDDGLFGDIPERLRFYIDYEAIARDLSVDYAMTEIAGSFIAYRCE